MFYDQCNHFPASNNISLETHTIILWFTYSLVLSPIGIGTYFLFIFFLFQRRLKLNIFFGRVMNVMNFINE